MHNPTQGGRLCFIADGQSVHTRRWLEAMVARGFEVHLITDRPAGIAGVTLHPLALRRSTLGWFAAIPAVRRLVRAIDPDLVHGHYVTSYGMLAAASGVHPLLLTAWGSDLLLSPRQNRLVHLLTGLILRRADYITADAIDVIEAIGDYHPRCPVEQVQWGIELDRFPPPLARTHAGIRFISLRSWEPLYQIPTLVRAFAEAAGKIGDCHLDLVGGGSQEAELRALVRELHLEERVTFHGFVNEARLRALLAAADVSISVPCADGTAMSLLESMAAGLPAIVSDLPANRQWIDREGGAVVPVGEVSPLAAAMVRLADDGEARHAAGLRNRRRVEQDADRRLEMDRVSARYRQLIRSCA